MKAVVWTTIAYHSTQFLNIMLHKCVQSLPPVSKHNWYTHSAFVFLMKQISLTFVQKLINSGHSNINKEDNTIRDRHGSTGYQSRMCYGLSDVLFWWP